MLDPWETATFRFEQISPLLDQRLSRAERRRLLIEKTREPVEWPQSETDRKAGKPASKKRISRSTLKRWLALYQEREILGLLPQPRKKCRRQSEEQACHIAYALGLLWQESDRSLTQLLAYLRLEFPDFSLSRSALHRRLLEHPAYEGIQKQRKGKNPRKLRDLYETSAPHECWQLDGKGPFTVHLESGRRIRAHVLSVIEHFSRKILATVIAAAEDTATAVRVFRIAAAEYGLPQRIQADRGSSFDSQIFRQGLAQLGVHRNWVEAGSPESQGAIEAFHKVLGRWFINELRHQEVVDLLHLEALLQATIAILYNQQHRHRVLKKTPDDALAGAISSRRVGVNDLLRAFQINQVAITREKTGEVILPNGVFRVPGDHAGKKRTFRYDPVEADQAVLVLRDGREIPLPLFAKKRAFTHQQDPAHGTGQLQKLLDIWRGKERPNAQAGFGLPEVFRELSRLLGYLVPKDEREAQIVQLFYRKYGPLPREPFTQSIANTARALGEGRPLRVYLDHLERRIRSHTSSGKDEPS